MKSDYKQARATAFASDPAIQKALKSGKVTRKDLVAHHLTPMEALRAFLFGDAADAGWRPDAAGNLVLLPKGEDAQKRLTGAMGGAARPRPYHDNGHDTWNRRRPAESARIASDLENEGYERGTPEYGKEAKRRLDALMERLRKELLEDRVTLIETPEAEAA